MSTIEHISKKADELQDELVEIRRDFHKYPETGWKEFRTVSKICRYLKDLGYDLSVGKDVVDEKTRMGLPCEEELQTAYERAKLQGGDEEFLEKLKGGFTGAVATLDTKKEGPTVAFRFDVDANDLKETNDPNHLPVKEGFASENENAMHGCGHDGHAAMGLGLAKLVKELSDNFTGKIKLIFQPAEEGVRGGRSMVEAGVLQDVDYCFGSHVGFGIEEIGKVTSGNESFLATTKLDVKYKGSPAHAGSTPEEGNNALLAASTAMLNLHSISRHSQGASRINVGTLQGGSGRNVIPASADMKIETRGATTEINEFIEKRAKDVIKGAATLQGVEYEILEAGGALASKSAEKAVKLVEQVASSHEKVTEFTDSSHFAGSEDFSYMMSYMSKKGAPHAYLVFGSPVTGGHHKENFDFDESVLSLGVDFLASLLYKITN
ncbi:amidohydrolase [Natranaerobius trueperi]|uniref:Peptidase M20 n=1 Tax=Natranaerobius trueperi TaxID=759412 RepID=A0A226C1D0_9FIRM|nr:amidohydrolase [Natranaerobius trueperi]OWZ84991.1 peptidase M20 [Natranaerobius trueperi]